MYEKVEKMLVKEILEKQQVPGFSVSIVKGSSIVWSKGFGYANIEKELPATPETVYRTASVSKPVIATGLLQLVERGKLDLDHPVNSVMENVKIETEFDEQPTVRNLLTHTSGLPVHADPTFFDVSELVSLEEMIRRSHAAIAVRPPGQEIVYSNVAFNIIGYLVGIFAGEPYPQYMKKNLFDPLEMWSSAFEQTPEIRKLMAQPYNRRGPDGTIEAVKPWYGASLPEKPCGSLFSTVIDLGHFLIAHMNGGMYKGRRILKRETLEEMHKLQARAGASRSGYALAWKRTMHHGKVMLSHTGGNLGWRAHVAFYPELKIGTAILCNNAAQNAGWRPPAREALDLIVDGILPFDPETIKMRVVPKQWKNLVGRYVRDAYIEVEDGNLILKRGAAKVYLERLDESRYLVHGEGNDGMELTFELDERGMAKQFDLDTETYPRFVEDKRLIDENADLIGTWRGKYVHPYGVFTMGLRIKSQAQATATDMLENVKPLLDFKACLGRVEGCFTFRNLPGYTTDSEELEIKLNLAAIEGKLEGRMIIARSTVPLILSKINDRKT